jgi:hypothetical protein
VLRSPGRDINFTVDGSAGDHGQAKLTAANGEVVVSGPDSWSVHMKYERSTTGLSLSLDSKPASDVLSDGKVLAKEGTSAHVVAAQHPISLQFGDESGPKLLLQYRTAKD